MFKINEEILLGIELCNGIATARSEFKKINTFESPLGQEDPYEILFSDFFEILRKEDLNFYDGKIQVINIIKEVDINLLESLLSFVRKYTHNLKLRVTKSKNNKHIYLCLDKVYNKQIYYVDNDLDAKKVYKSLGIDSWI